MHYDWDPGKAESNLAKHGVPFDTIRDFEWKTAYTVEDTRFDYGERRFQSIGWIDDRLHKVLYTYSGDVIRIISMWKANRRDQRKYHDRESRLP